MAKTRVRHNDTEVEVEVGDLHAVLIILGLAAAALAGIYMATRNPQTLRSIAEIAVSRGKVLVERGVPVLT